MNLEGTMSRYISVHTQCDCRHVYVYYRGLGKIGHNNQEQLMKCSKKVSRKDSVIVQVKREDIENNTTE